MKIVDRATFMQLPPGTIYAKWGDAERTCKNSEAHFYGEVSVKGGNCGVDFVDEPLFASPEDTYDDATLHDAWSAALNGKETAPMRIGDDGCRDGMFEEKQLFAVYSAVEARRLRDLIDWCIENAYA